jgi:catechol 2,3-dioxygenase-like lactoylglutathione lyase family enzyme
MTASRASSDPGIVLDHVQIAAPPGCEEAARRFFGELLGLPEIEKPEALRARGGVWFAVGSQQLHVGVESDFAPARKAHPAFRVPGAGLDPLAHRLADAGVAVNWDDALAGVRRFFCADPWGNRIEILAVAG